jgi:recombinational DNA repair protein RecR
VKGKTFEKAIKKNSHHYQLTFEAGLQAMVEGATQKELSRIARELHRLDRKYARMMRHMSYEVKFDTVGCVMCKIGPSKKVCKCCKYNPRKSDYTGNH